MRLDISCGFTDLCIARNLPLGLLADVIHGCSIGSLLYAKCVYSGLSAILGSKVLTGTD